MKIGSIVIDNNIKIDNVAMNPLQEEIKKAKSEIQEKKKAADKDVYNIEESSRNLDRKIRCPKCGQVYEKRRICCSVQNAEAVWNEQVKI